MEYIESDHTYDEEYVVLSDTEILEDKVKIKIKLGVSRYNSIRGITCYMNSILHILQQIPIFVKYIYDFEFEQVLQDKIDKTASTMNEYVIYELHRLFRTSLNNDDSIITPKTFKNLIGTKNEIWNELNHQDSQEFFNFLISQIKEEIGIKVSFVPKLNYSRYENRYIQDSINSIIANHGLTTYQSHEYSPLTELFDGLYKDTCSCMCCNSTNIKFEPFLTLAVDINNNDDLYECLDDLCCDQQLDIDNKLVCGFCGLSNKAHKKTLLWKTPKILVIHIKRFGIAAQKITTNINYPIKNLDLSNYIDSKSPFKSYCKYDLIGINIHKTINKNMNFGHYISIVKNKINNNWYLYNDGNDPEIQDYEDLQDRDAYLLFYYRHN
jgi:ubiquitin C-terminal hydrolase